MSLDVNVVKQLDGFDLDVRFRVPAGISVFFGDSGAGKSLTLRMIAGLLRPDRGRITLSGQVLYDERDRIWVRPQSRPLGFVFQHDSLFPHLTVRQNVLFGGRELDQATRRQRAQALLQKLNLEHLADKAPRDISGGQKQRVAVIRCLMRQPRGLLLDEPFSALDLLNRKAMRECLVGVMRELSIPVILVTHDLVEALTLADHLLLFAEGRVVQQGRPEAIVAKPANDHVAALADLDNLRVPASVRRCTSPQRPQ